MKGLKAVSIAMVLVMVFCGAAMAGRSGQQCGDRAEGKFYGHGGGFMGFKLLKELNLSETQKTQIANVLAKYREEGKNLTDSLAQAKKNVLDLVTADEFNEAAIRQAAQNAASVKEELAVMGAKVFAEIKPLLTAEQLNLLKTRKAEMAEKMKSHAASKRSKLETWIESHIE